MSSNIEDVRYAICDLNINFPRPGLILELSELYDLRQFSRPYPNVGLPGVYIFLDEIHTVLRIGKASCGRTLGGRLGDYFRWDRKTGTGISKDPIYTAVRYLATIGVPAERSFEAPAIEEYLLRRIHAPLNSLGAVAD